MPINPIDSGSDALARSERFELPTLGFEVRCSIQLSYERKASKNNRLLEIHDAGVLQDFGPARSTKIPAKPGNTMRGRG
jgi:hypothetical protein